MTVTSPRPANKVFPKKVPAKKVPPLGPPPPPAEGTGDDEIELGPNQFVLFELPAILDAEALVLTIHGTIFPDTSPVNTIVEHHTWLISVRIVNNLRAIGVAGSQLAALRAAYGLAIGFDKGRCVLTQLDRLRVEIEFAD